MSRVWLMVVCVVSLAGFSFSVQAQEEAAVAVPAADLAEAAAPTAVVSAKPATEAFKLGGLRRRIFTDRDAQKYRVEEEDVWQALTAAKESGDITPDMSIVEKARVIFKQLQTKPENSTAFAPLTKAKTPQERLVSVREIANAIKAIVRILEMFESVFGEL